MKCVESFKGDQYERRSEEAEDVEAQRQNDHNAKRRSEESEESEAKRPKIYIRDDEILAKAQLMDAATCTDVVVIWQRNNSTIFTRSSYVEDGDTLELRFMRIWKSDVLSHVERPRFELGCVSFTEKIDLAPVHAANLPPASKAKNHPGFSMWLFDRRTRVVFKRVPKTKNRYTVALYLGDSTADPLIAAARTSAHRVPSYIDPHTTPQALGFEYEDRVEKFRQLIAAPMPLLISFSAAAHPDNA